MDSGCGPCGNPCGSVTIYQGYAKTFFIDLFYTDTQAPYDLTGALEIVAAFPPTTPGPPVEETLGSGEVVVIGAPGAGRVQIKLTAVNSALVQLNPNEQQFQDLQISVTNADGSLTCFIIPSVLNIAVPVYGVV